MNPKKFLTVIIIFLFTVVFSPERSGFESNSGVNIFGSLNSVSTVYDYTYVEVLINNEWWIQIYDDKNELVDEYPVDC
ncbi:MAG TPA: hypothetical protein PKA90_16080 [Ignavibacteria bacterium]|nr:hypothetical protein [Ignavibacteria bacterium]HMR41936.1 hypothetical protein [Ignavibacteria bacterium]